LCFGGEKKIKKKFKLSTITTTTTSIFGHCSYVCVHSPPPHPLVNLGSLKPTSPFFIIMIGFYWGWVGGLLFRKLTIFMLLFSEKENLTHLFNSML
jgi:hypothetical protein